MATKVASWPSWCSQGGRLSAPSFLRISSPRPYLISASSSSSEEDPAPPPDDFDQRLAKIQRKVTSGSGKKAEKRKARKSGDFSSSFSTTTSKADVLLPPVPLQDPVSDGLKVELGFNSYTERLNGRFAALGLAAVLLVELASGQSFLKYHSPSIVGVQVYFMLAVSAIYVKYEKEKISVWPKS